MNFLNMCVLEGNITSDAECRKNKNSSVVTQFTIAQNRNYVNSQNELTRETSFFDVEVWGEGFAAKTSKFLTKGTPVRVIGRVKIDRWNDEEGKRKERMVLVCEKFDFLPNMQRDENKKFTSGELYNTETEALITQEIVVEEENKGKSKKKKEVI